MRVSNVRVGTVHAALAPSALTIYGMMPGARPDAGMFTQLLSFAGALVAAVLISVASTG